VNEEEVFSAKYMKYEEPTEFPGTKKEQDMHKRLEKFEEEKIDYTLDRPKRIVIRAKIVRG